MELNCNQITEKYLLNQNPLYAFSFPLSILIAIIVFGISKAYNWSSNSYINQILIPILALLITMVIIDIVARLMISKTEKMRALNKCNLWINNKQSFDDKSNLFENFTIQDNSYSNKLNNNKEKIHIIENKIQENNIEEPISQIKSISPFPLESKQNKSQCISDSDCYNLCSGNNSNPFNIIAPIPGPQWLPQSAAAMQNRLKNSDYTPSKCTISY